MRSPIPGYSVSITRKDGTSFLSSSGLGEGRAFWSKRNRQFAVAHKRQLREAGLNAKVVPVLYTEPEIIQ